MNVYSFIKTIVFRERLYNVKYIFEVVFSWVIDGVYENGTWLIQII